MNRTEMKEFEIHFEENRCGFMARLKDLPKNLQMDIDMAYDLAKESHRPQKRDSGERYFEHVRAVALILIDELKIKNPDLIIACLLHDTLEDSATFGNTKLDYSVWTKTAQYRFSKVFNSNIANLVIALTKPKFQNYQDFYLNNLKNSSPETILIKMCDRLHNLRCLKNCNLHKQERICQETINHYFEIFKITENKYPVEYQFLISEMKKEIFALNL